MGTEILEVFEKVKKKKKKLTSLKSHDWQEPIKMGCGKGNTETLELDDTLWGRGAGVSRRLEPRGMARRVAWEAG